MSRKPSAHPTDAELAILQILWRRGPSTVREVHTQLEPREAVGYTTVLKTLQIMTDKGLVERDETDRAHVYAPLHSEEQTQQGMLNDLVQRVFQGSASKMVMRALSGKRASREEIAEIRRMLDEISGEEE